MTHQKHGCGAIILSTHCLNPKEHLWTRAVCKNSTPMILLLQRGCGAPSFASHWGCPAGLADAGESPAKAAEREAYEEISISFTADNLPFWTGEMPDRKLSYFLGKWMAPYPGPKLQATNGVWENDGFGWFTLPSALRLDLSFRYRDAINYLQSQIG